MQVSLNAILITGNMTLFGYTGKDKIKSLFRLFFHIHRILRQHYSAQKLADELFSLGDKFHPHIETDKTNMCAVPYEK